MLLPPPIPFRSRKRRAASGSPAPAALTLVAASIPSEGMLRLQFDREVSAAGLVADQIIVNDASGTGWAYVGQDLQDQPDPDTIVIGMTQNGAATGTLDWVTASAGTGIVAVDDGGTWAGVTQVGLPYP